MNELVGLLPMLPPLLFALTVHEFSHGYAALRLGDPTARLLGRLTLNPIAHLDWLGTVVFLIPPHIGWAKPVPVDSRYLRHPRRDFMWIAAAGPVSNIVLALLFGLLLRVVVPLAGPSAMANGATSTLLTMIAWSVVLNLGLATFNLIPIHPLDGSRILGGLLNAEWAERYRTVEPFGPMLLLGLILLGSLTGVSVFGMLVGPVIRVVGSLVTGGVL